MKLIKSHNIRWNDIVKYKYLFCFINITLYNCIFELYQNNIYLIIFDSAARYGSRILQKLPAVDRASAIYALAELLISKQAAILDANEKDIAIATKEGTAAPLISRLSLTPAKLKSLAIGKIYLTVKYNNII